MKLKVKLFGKNILASGSPAEKKIDYSDYYPFTVICKNCNKMTQVLVKKGVHINDVITGVKCNYCDCRLEKQEK
jgi:lysyl-tRNA synthetase class I